MRNRSKFASGFLTAVAAVSSTHAAVIASDSFTYNDGTAIVGQAAPVGGTWASHSGANGPVTVNGGKIAIVQGPSATYAQDVNLPFAGGVVAGATDSATVASKLYASFDLSVSLSGTATSIIDTYFAHYLNGSSNFAERLWVTAGATSGYRLALSNASSITANGVAKTDDLAYGTTYTVVISYDYNAKTGSLWINPADATSTHLDATDTQATAYAVGAFAFRQGSPATLNSTETVDNLKVGTTFADVIAPAPEPASLSLVGLAATGLLARRRKQA